MAAAAAAAAPAEAAAAAKPVDVSPPKNTAREDWLAFEEKRQAYLEDIARADAKLKCRPPERITLTAYAPVADAKGSTIDSLMLSRRACTGSLLWAAAIAGEPETKTLPVGVAFPTLRWVASYLAHHNGTYCLPYWERVRNSCLSEHHANDADVKAVDALWTGDRGLFWDVVVASSMLDIRPLFELLSVKVATVLKFQHSAAVAAALSA